MCLFKKIIPIELIAIILGSNGKQHPVEEDKKEPLLDITLLGFTQKWLDYGILDREDLAAHVKEYQKGEDPNKEHYRYGQFISYLNRKDSITTQEIDNYLEIALEESVMGGSAARALFLSSAIITEEQYQYIKSRLSEFGKWTEKLIAKTELNRRIDREEII